MIEPYVQRNGRGWMDVMLPAAELARSIADTEFVPRTLRGNAAAITAAILYGDEVGLGPMQSLARISVIDGRPTLSAEAQRGLILAAGHDLWVEESSVSRVTVAGRRANSDQTTRITWTLDDAKRANLAGKPNWRNYPRQMLLARASAELARAVFADAVGGLAATEEIDELGAIETALTSEIGPAAASAPPSRQRRSRPARNPAAQVGGPTRGTTPPVEPPPLPGDDTPPPSKPPPDTPPELPGDELFEAPPAENPSPPEPPLRDGGETGGTDPGKPTQPQLKQLNVFMGTLRDPGHVSNEGLWQAVANMRGQQRDELVDELGGRDDQGNLHWTPLRLALTRVEARRLIEGLRNLEHRLDLEQARGMRHESG